MSGLRTGKRAWWCEGVFASGSSIPLGVCFSYHVLRLAAIKHLQTPFPELWESSLKMFSYGFPAEYFSNKACSVIESIPVAALHSAVLVSKNQAEGCFLSASAARSKPSVFYLSSCVLSDRWAGCGALSACVKACCQSINLFSTDSSFSNVV